MLTDDEFDAILPLTRPMPLAVREAFLAAVCKVPDNIIAEIRARERNGLIELPKLSGLSLLSAPAAALRATGETFPWLGEEAKREAEEDRGRPATR